MFNSILGRGTRSALLLAAAALGLAAPVPARAALGGPVASVESDRVRMQGSHTVTAATGYSVHELTASTGTVVREFVSAEGTVFAVAWQGPFMPNLRQLLGDYYEPFSRAAQAKGTHRAVRRPMLVRGPGFVVESGGRMRALFGRAYLPERLPARLEEEGIR